MCAKRLEEIEAWQLAMDVRRQVFAIARHGPVLADKRFRDDLLASARAVAKNIGEGFGRYRPAEFANKLRIALGELRETETALVEGQEDGYFAAADVERIRRTIDRAANVAKKLHTYLENCAQRGLYERRSTERPARKKPGRLGPRSNGENAER